jgi:cytosine/adenosine deaminase-related metal-dependent hydrolase
MDDARRELRDGAPLARGGVIERASTLAELPATAERVIGLRGHVLSRGLVTDC